MTSAAAGVPLPSAVLQMADRGADWATWIHDLPGLTASLLSHWELQQDGAATHGFTALVVPVRSETGQAAVLKVGFPDADSEHEHLVLRRWNGRGAVRLLRADPHRRALLLERLRPVDLRSIPAIQACEVIGQRYRQLHVPALPQLRPLSGCLIRWLAAWETLPREAPIPRRMVEQARHWGRHLAADPAIDTTVVHGDLHYENVLAAEREPWLVIDPKGLNGDPHYEPAPLLWNRWEEIAAAHAVRSAVRYRFDTVVDVAGLDELRARHWVGVRMVLNAHWAIERARVEQRTLTAGERDWVTRCVAIVKAIQP